MMICSEGDGLVLQLSTCYVLDWHTCLCNKPIWVQIKARATQSAAKEKDGEKRWQLEEPVQGVQE